MGFLQAEFGRSDYVCAQSHLDSLSIYGDCPAALTRVAGRTVVLGRPALSPPGRLIAVAEARLADGAGGGRMTVMPVPVTEAERAALEGDLPSLRPGDWYAFLCRFEGGRCDVLYARMAGPRQLTEARKALQVVWPLLRQAALADREERRPEGHEAMLWAMACKSDLATFITDREGRLMETNAAGRELLGAGQVLRETGDRLEAGPQDDRRRFREALEACGAVTDPEAATQTLFLGENGGTPVCLTRFFRAGQPTELIVITAPVPPRTDRIGELTQIRGLTRTEARIAQLLYLGLTNRETAQATGLSEETVKTYAKRVLHKLNVTRSGLAHMLTWQASGGRMASSQVERTPVAARKPD